MSDTKQKLLIVDANALVHRAFHALPSTMITKDGVPTNATYGFVSILSKALKEIKPDYIAVCFDVSKKTFRNELYTEYKANRAKQPDELYTQFKFIKEIVRDFNINIFEQEGFEADDIIGTICKKNNSKEIQNIILTGDKDTFQLVNDNTEVYTFKTGISEFCTYDAAGVKEKMGVNPDQIIDYKALRGDPSDNIPGVKGIGEKTAINLISKYCSLDGVYEHIDEISGKTKEKLVNDKENAYFSYKLATIYKTIPFEYTFDSIKYNGINRDALIDKYKELEFNSFLKNIPDTSIKVTKDDYEIVKGKINIEGKRSLYIELDGINYHTASFVGAAIYDGNKSYYFDQAALMLNKDLLKNVCVTFDNKKNNVFLNKYNMKVNVSFDTMIGAYLLNYNVKDDISYLATSFGVEIPYYEEITNTKKVMSDEERISAIVLKSKFLYDTYEEFNNKLKSEELYDLYYDIEHPLIYVLSDMEINGICVDTKVIDDLKIDIKERIDKLEQKIYDLSGEEFNISSPKQLGEILYNKLNLPKGRGKNATSTAHDVLIKYKNIHPIINEILEYRNLSKLVSTYIDTFNSYILSDGKIHTIYKQTGTRTGRLSSVDPNLQNIPVRSEEGKKIRKAFLASENSYLLSSDYSQIELRVLAHISNSISLQNAFINGEDIHTRVAADIFNIPFDEVTPNMRRTAKSVIFGIVYGISGYGLSENLDISQKEAKEYIDKYLNLYPEVAKYMKDIVEETKKTGYVRTLCNRKREIEEIKNTNYLIRSSGERMALNTPIQGTSADILKLAMIEIFNKLNEGNYKTKMLLQVHDELIFDVPEEELEEIKVLVKDTMENIFKLSVPLKVSIDYGKNWYEAK